MGSAAEDREWLEKRLDRMESNSDSKFEKLHSRISDTSRECRDDVKRVSDAFIEHRAKPCPGAHPEGERQDLKDYEIEQEKNGDRLRKWLLVGAVIGAGGGGAAALKMLVENLK